MANTQATPHPPRGGSCPPPQAKSAPYHLFTAQSCHIGPPEVGPRPKHALLVPSKLAHGPDGPSWPMGQLSWGRGYSGEARTGARCPTLEKAWTGSAVTTGPGIGTAAAVGSPPVPTEGRGASGDNPFDWINTPRCPPADSFASLQKKSKRC